MNKQNYAKNMRGKSRIKSAITGLALLALTNTANAGLIGSTKLEIMEEDLPGAPKDTLYIEYRDDSFVNSGLDAYDVLKSDAGSPSFTQGLTLSSHIASGDNLAIDARQKNNDAFSILFEPVNSGGDFQTDKARIRFSNLVGDQEFRYSAFFGEGLTTDNGGYTPYFSYNSTSGSFSMNFNPVPEPSSLALFGIGALVVGLRRYFRDKKK